MAIQTVIIGLYPPNQSDEDSFLQHLFELHVREIIGARPQLLQHLPNLPFKTMFHMTTNIFNTGRIFSWQGIPHNNIAVNLLHSNFTALYYLGLANLTHTDHEEQRLNKKPRPNKKLQSQNSRSS